MTQTDSDHLRRTGYVKHNFCQFTSKYHSLRLCFVALLLLCALLPLISAFQSPSSPTVSRGFLPSTSKLPVPVPHSPWHTTSMSSHPSLRLLAKQKKNKNNNKSNKDDDDEKEKGTPLAMFTPILIGIGSTTSTVVAVAFFWYLSIRRDTLMVSFFIGAILNAILSKVLKRIFGQLRPLHNDNSSGSTKKSISRGRNGIVIHPSDGGMPSSHAMSLGFIGTFTAYAAHLSGWKLALLIAYIATSLWYRVMVSLHTIAQIGVGLVLGVVGGAVWWYGACGAGEWPQGLVTYAVHMQLKALHGERLPLVFLAIPLLMGLMVVGSFERRISGWLAEKKARRKAPL
jgi:membrane-associated phospholipid phosphatase